MAENSPWRHVAMLSVWYLRHEAEFPSGLHPLPFLDIVSWDGALSAHCVSGSVPVWILSQKHNIKWELIQMSHF